MVDSGHETFLCYESWPQTAEQTKSEKNIVYFCQHSVLKYLNISYEIFFDIRILEMTS